MIGTKSFFTYCQGALEQRFGVAVEPLGLVQNREIVDRRSDIRMIWTERRFPNAQSALRQWCRLGITSLAVELFDLCIQRGDLSKTLR
jgi:hypothetical protein